MHIGKTLSVVIIVGLSGLAAASLHGERVEPEHTGRRAPQAELQPGARAKEANVRAGAPRSAHAAQHTPQQQPPASFEDLLEEARALATDERKARLADLDRTLEDERWVERANMEALAPAQRAELAGLMRERNALSVATAEALLASLRTRDLQADESLGGGHAELMEDE